MAQRKQRKLDDYVYDGVNLARCRRSARIDAQVDAEEQLAAQAAPQVRTSCWNAYVGTGARCRRSARIDAQVDAEEQLAAQVAAQVQGFVDAEEQLATQAATQVRTSCWIALLEAREERARDEAEFGPWGAKDGAADAADAAAAAADAAAEALCNRMAARRMFRDLVVVIVGFRDLWTSLNGTFGLCETSEPLYWEEPVVPKRGAGKWDGRYIVRLPCGKRCGLLPKNVTFPGCDDVSDEDMWDSGFVDSVVQLYDLTPPCPL